eukprot:760659-Hanusia_phi.AAC.8
MDDAVGVESAAPRAEGDGADVLIDFLLAREHPVHGVLLDNVPVEVSRIVRCGHEVETGVVGRGVAERQPACDVLGHELTVLVLDERGLDVVRQASGHPVLRLPVSVGGEAILPLARVHMPCDHVEVAEVPPVRQLLQAVLHRADCLPALVVHRDEGWRPARRHELLNPSSQQLHMRCLHKMTAPHLRVSLLHQLLLHPLIRTEILPVRLVAYEPDSFPQRHAGNEGGRHPWQRIDHARGGEVMIDKDQYEEVEAEAGADRGVVYCSARGSSGSALTADLHSSSLTPLLRIPCS